jgi:hypothetical protein
LVAGDGIPTFGSAMRAPGRWCSCVTHEYPCGEPYSVPVSLLSLFPVDGSAPAFPSTHLIEAASAWLGRRWRELGCEGLRVRLISAAGWFISVTTFLLEEKLMRPLPADAWHHPIR